MHIPSFNALEKTEQCLLLKVAKPSLNLRHVIEDKEFLTQYGHLIIRGLLETLEELRKVDATLHTLEP